MLEELGFIYNEYGIKDAVFYFFYQLELWFKLRPFNQRKRAEREKRIEKLYSIISAFKNGIIEINGEKYIAQKLEPSNQSIIKLRMNSSDTKVFAQVILKQEYKSVIEIYNQFFFTPAKLIVDCGANIGLASIYFFQHFPNASFMAIEPFKENVAMIRLNFEGCGLFHYTILEGGVWNKDTDLFINREFRDREEWSIALSESGDGKIIKGYSLAKLIEKTAEAIDILKIDIEGAEVKLFESNDYAKRFLKKVKCVVIEIHDEFGIRNNIYELLKENGFFYYNTNELTIGIQRNYIY